MPSPDRRHREASPGATSTGPNRDTRRSRLPVGLQIDDLNRVIEQFGVSEAQVRRDHAISLILAALSEHYRTDLLFFGGTALSRTYLDAERLSEDVDLIATTARDEIAQRLTQTIERALQRTHGRVSWVQHFSANSDVVPAIATTSDRIAITIQLLRFERYEPWPSTEHEIEQRYRDVRPAVLRTPTLPAFAGWKTSAWLDRAAPRDLYDLWAMGRVGALDDKAAALFAKHGPTGARPRSWMFTKPPSEQDWQAQLAGQTRLTITAAQALAGVRRAWEQSLGSDW